MMSPVLSTCCSTCRSCTSHCTLVSAAAHQLLRSLLLTVNCMCCVCPPAVLLAGAAGPTGKQVPAAARHLLLSLPPTTHFMCCPPAVLLAGAAPFIEKQMSATACHLLRSRSPTMNVPCAVLLAGAAPPTAHWCLLPHTICYAALCRLWISCAVRLLFCLQGLHLPLLGSRSLLLHVICYSAFLQL
jgi:hypothetical protein